MFQTGQKKVSRLSGSLTGQVMCMYELTPENNDKAQRRNSDEKRKCNDQEGEIRTDGTGNKNTW